MPELPDLEVVRENLGPQLTGVEIVAAEVRRPVIVRNLLRGDLNELLAGRSFSGVGRRGKFLLFPLAGGLTLVIHPMLAGRLYYSTPPKKRRVRDALVLRLSNGLELCYHDAKDMGKVYLVNELDQVPGFATLGPEATDPELTAEVFAVRLKRYRGEIKRTLTTQTFVAGIGNAYADEICWQAHIYPFLRRSRLSPADVQNLYTAMRQVLNTAIETLRERVGNSTTMEVRDFLAVHGRPGEPCPRCGATISEVKRERRATHFCRQCQPGLLVGR